MPDLQEMLATIKELGGLGSDVAMTEEILRAVLERAKLPIPEELGQPMQAGEGNPSSTGRMRRRRRMRYVAGAESGRIISRRNFLFGGGAAT